MLNLGSDDVWSQVMVDGTVLREAPLAEVCNSTVQNNIIGLEESIKIKGESWDEILTFN